MYDVVTRGAALLLGLAASIVFSAGTAVGQTKWNLASSFPPDNYHTENLRWFAKEIETATGGRLQITVHPGASLFKAPEIKRAVATAQIQMGEVLISLHENEDSIFGLDTIPFLASGFEEAKKLWLAQKPAITSKLDAQGIVLLHAVPWGPQGIYAKKVINVVEDLKGLKMRAYNVGTTRIAEMVGAQPVTVHHAELPQALATGMLGWFFSSSSTGYETRVWETMTHWYDVQGWIPKNMVFVNRDALSGLPKDQQDAILASATAAEDRGWKIASDKSIWYANELTARGMKVEAPAPELKAALKKIGDQLTEDWLRKAASDGKAVVEAYRR